MPLGFLNLLICIISITFIVVYNTKAGKLKVYVPQGSEEKFERRMTSEEKTNLFNIYRNVFFNLNIRTCMSVMTDFLINDLHQKLKIYNKFGIRREIVFVPKVEKERNDSYAAYEMGKYASYTDSENGSYMERFVDITTNTVLWQRKWDKAELAIKLIRNPDAKTRNVLLCNGCGTPVQVDGEIYVCKNCGAKYSADSFDWMIGGVLPSNKGVVSGQENESTVFNLGIKFIGIFAIFMPFIGFFSGVSPVIAALTWINIVLCLLMFGIGIIFVIKKNAPYKTMLQIDPLMSPQKIADRATYLTSLMYGCFEEDPSKMKPFMDEPYFNIWKNNLNLIKQLQGNNSHIFHWEVNGDAATINKFWTDNNRQHVTIGVPTEYLYITDEKQAHVKKMGHVVTMYRNINTRYRSASDVESTVCPGCGMPVDLTATGRCKYCGNTFPIEYFDWKIESYHLIDVKGFNKMVNNPNAKLNPKQVKKCIKELSVDKAALPPEMHASTIRCYQAARQTINKQAPQQPQQQYAQPQQQYPNQGYQQPNQQYNPNNQNNHPNS